jgi:hypothetical protein
MAFSPSSYTFNNLSANQTANFTRTTTATYRVGGRVTDANGNGIGGVQVGVPGSVTPSGNFPILPVTTDGLGYYAMDLPKGQDYHVTPTSGLYTFTPSSITFVNLSSSQTANFSATPVSLTISGRIADGPNGVAGVSVNFTASGSSQATAVLTDANGFYNFTSAVAGQTYTITPSKTGYLFEPENRVVFASPFLLPQSFLGSTNPIDNSRFFVAQHYRDFLSREPDDNGWNFWTNDILGCGTFMGCREDKRINTSGAFFLSIEFQETGYLVERINKAAYGDADGTSVLGGTPHQIKVPVVKFQDFLADTQKIGKDVVVQVGNWQAQLENNKVAFTQEFVTRQAFVSAYSGTMTPATFVDALFDKAGVTPSDAERASIINEFGGAGTSGDTAARARALRRVAENAVLTLQEKNKAFVLMQYFGYLRRDPNGAPDTDHTGYDYWLHKLNDFNGNFVNAEMVKAFLVSAEYRQRFGP